MARELLITVKEIYGNCPAYKKGNRIILQNGYKIDTKRTCPYICMHSLASIIPYYNALYHRIAPSKLGLKEKISNKAVVRCLDPYEYTGGGSVVFEIEIIEREVKLLLEIL